MADEFHHYVGRLNGTRLTEDEVNRLAAEDMEEYLKEQSGREPKGLSSYDTLRVSCLSRCRATMIDPSFPSLLRRADRIHRFPAKISPRVALSFLGSISENYRKESLRGVRFHDPMCGSGTAALTARVLGFAVSASDIMYPAFTITTAKLCRLRESALGDFSDFPSAIELSKKKPPKRQWQNWRLWYRPRVLRSLEDISEVIASNRTKPFFSHLLTAFFQTAWDVSAADKRVAVPTRSQYSPKSLNISPQNVLNIFCLRLKRVKEAQEALGELGLSPTRPKVFQRNALEESEWPDGRIDIIFTSPPYGCGVDYERAFRLQTRLSAFFSSKTYPRSKFIGRTSSLGSDVDALPASEKEATWFKRIRQLNDNRLRMFLQYAHDIKMFIRISARRISRKGRLCLVIGNPQIARREVPLSRIIQKLASEEGFALETSPQRDQIKSRMQNFPLRSANSHINQEYLLSFKRS